MRNQARDGSDRPVGNPTERYRVCPEALGTSNGSDTPRPQAAPPDPYDIEMETLEIDKLSSAAMTHHFESLIGASETRAGSAIAKVRRQSPYVQL
jgi:hypothetical protein